MSRIAVWVGIAVVAGLVGPEAGADELTGMHEAKLTETLHLVTASLDRRLVVYTVRRTFHNSAKHADELRLEIHLPSSAVATALRVRMAGRWHRGALLGHKKARSIYDDLISTGPERRRGPALLSWHLNGELALEVFPVPGRGTITVEYQLVAPACYSDGHFIADYHALASKNVGLVTPSIRVRNGGVLATAAQLKKRLNRADLDDVCGDSSGDHYIAFKRARPSAVSARAGSYRVGPGSHIIGYDIDIARVLLPKPRRARVVFVVDASRSVGLANIRAQLSLIRGYISHLQDASFEVVLYRRFAERLFGRFASATDAERALTRVTDARIKPGNGSNLERGMALTTRLLSGYRGPQRVIAFTDSRFRAGFAPKLVRDATVGSSALVHYVDLQLGRGALAWERDDKHPLSATVGATGGVVATMSGRSKSVAVSRRAIASLVQPDQVDQLRVIGFTGGAVNKPATYRQGRGLRGILVSKKPLSSLRVFGKVWGRAIQLNIKPGKRFSRALPRLVFGGSQYASLPSKRLAAVARAGRVVSPVTSLLARDRTMRHTSYQGDILGYSRTYSISSRCGGPRGMMGRGYLGPRIVRVPPAYAAILRASLADRIAGCDLLHSTAKRTRLGISIETTGVEIVDVKVTGATTKLHRCVREAAWELALDDRFVAAHGRYSFSYATKFGTSSCAASSRRPCSQKPSKTRASSTVRR